MAFSSRRLMNASLMHAGLKNSGSPHCATTAADFRTRLPLTNRRLDGQRCSLYTQKDRCPGLPLSSQTPSCRTLNTTPKNDGHTFFLDQYRQTPNRRNALAKAAEKYIELAKVSKGGGPRFPTIPRTFAVDLLLAGVPIGESFHFFLGHQSVRITEKTLQPVGRSTGGSNSRADVGECLDARSVSSPEDGGYKFGTYERSGLIN